MNKRRILLIGRGFLGEVIWKTGIESGYEIIGTHYSQQDSDTISLDISNAKEVKKVILNINPDYIINTAAANDLDFLEHHPDSAMLINKKGPQNIATIAKENKIRFLHISTDSVFDGKTGQYSENDIPNPINTYAKSRYEGELEIQRNSNDYVIVRTNFYGIDRRGRYFFNWILNNVKSNKAMIGFTDIVFSPLDTFTLSKMIIELLETEFIGIMHLSSGDPISKFNFIMEVVNKLGTNVSVTPGKQDEQHMIAPRPRNTSLKNDLAKKLLKTPIMSLTDWLEINRSEISKYLK